MFSLFLLQNSFYTVITGQHCKMVTFSVCLPYTGREGGREGGRVGGREGGREVGREGGMTAIHILICMFNSTPMTQQYFKQQRRFAANYLFM